MCTHSIRLIPLVTCGADLAGDRQQHAPGRSLALQHPGVSIPAGWHVERSYRQSKQLLDGWLLDAVRLSL